MALLLNEFKLETAVLEIRYPAAYLIWDRHGSIWHSLCARFEDLKSTDAKPDKTSFRLGDDFEFTCQVDKASITAFEPDPSLKRTKELAEAFFGEVIPQLEISTLGRIGCRLVYHKEYPSREKASAAVLSTGLFSLPASCFGIDAPPLGPEIVARYESKDLGFRIALQERRRGIVVDTPPGHGIGRISKEKLGCIFDVDSYSLAPAPVEIFQASTFIDQTRRLVGQNADALLSGGSR